MYRMAAEAWKSDRTNNPDGWYADPEAICAVEEAMFDYERAGMDPVEAARSAWRFNRDKFVASGGVQVWYAGEMVAIELMIAERQA